MFFFQAIFVAVRHWGRNVPGLWDFFIFFLRVVGLGTRRTSISRSDLLLIHASSFAAEYYGLPPVPPYLMGANHRSNSRFQAGLNFAVAGATALDVPFYGEKGISSTLANISMFTQLRWFKGLLPSLCNSSSKYFLSRRKNGFKAQLLVLD